MKLTLFLAWIAVALNAISVACEDPALALLNVERPTTTLSGETRRVRGSGYVYDDKTTTSMLSQQQGSEDGSISGTPLHETIDTYSDMQVASSDIGDSTQLVMCFVLLVSLSALCALAAQHVYGEKSLLSDEVDRETSPMIISPAALI